jgi:hypothetical protein
MTLLGFASFLLGLAALLVALTLWLELLAKADENPAGRGVAAREIAFAVAAPLVFLAHGFAFVLLAILAAVAVVAAGSFARRGARLRAFVPAAALVAYAAWTERAAAIPAGSAPVPMNAPGLHFQGPWDKFTLLITPTLMTRTGIDFTIGVFVWAFLLLATMTTVRALARHAVEARYAVHARALLAGGATLFGLFLALPHAIGWFGFVDGRLVPLVVILPLLAIPPGVLGPRLARVLGVGAPLGASTLAALALAASYAFQSEARGYRSILAEIPPETRLLNLPVEPNSAVFTGHPFIHYDKLAMVDRPLAPSDVWFHQGSAIYPRPANPILALPASYSESNLGPVEWADYRIADWDYVLVRTRPEGGRPFTPAPLVLVDHQGGWWLFKNDDPRRPR